MKRTISVFFLILAAALLPSGSPASGEIQPPIVSFVEQMLVPAAAADEDTAFTRQELDLLLEAAAKNSVVFPEEQAARLAGAAQLHEVELIELVLGSEYGSYPMAWPWEIFLWYDQLCMQLGYLSGESNLCMPAEGEPTEAEALETAKAAILQSYGYAPERLEGENCIMERCFYRQLTPEGAEERLWLIHVFWTDHPILSHTVIIAPDGSIRAME
ncbi:MAG: hypothetical protein J6K73_09730 [Clostridia bacterium]|nr:hypothetical protein [Clostridia bacterium]